MKLLKKISIALILGLTFIFSGCQSVDNERLPNMPVNISLADPGSWVTYGVSGYGSHRKFILTEHQPANFQYTTKSATGYGGVLLIEGLDPFMENASVPMAYDLACPVERKPDVRIEIDPESYMAKCKECGSVYDVTMQRGGPIAGPAATSQYKCGLKIYNCVPSGTGGYFITN